eukprot:764954-Hanusia_phi.AAC.4
MMSGFRHQSLQTFQRVSTSEGRVVASANECLRRRRMPSCSGLRTHKISEDLDRRSICFLQSHTASMMTSLFLVAFCSLLSLPVPPFPVFCRSYICPQHEVSIPIID